MFCCFISDVFPHQYYTTSGARYQTEASADALVVLYWLEEGLLLLQDVLLWMAMTEQSTLFMSPGHWQWCVYSLVKTSPSSGQAVLGHINHTLLLTVGTATDSCPNKLYTVVQLGNLWQWISSSHHKTFSCHNNGWDLVLLLGIHLLRMLQGLCCKEGWAVFFIFGKRDVFDYY